MNRSCLTMAVLLALLALLGCGQVACRTNSDQSPNAVDKKRNPVAMDELERALSSVSSGDRSASLRIKYIRGHALSGMTTFEMDQDGDYTFATNQTPGREEIERSGRLPAEDTRALWQAAADAGVLQLESVKRIRADDEVPVIVELYSGEYQHRVVMWHADASALPIFRDMEKRLEQIFERFTEGKIGLGLEQ